MIDLSDGLASDLKHILEASGGLGAVLDADAIPIHDDARAQSLHDGRSPLEHALRDGEDFELCFTVAPDAAKGLETQALPDVSVSRVGTVQAATGDLAAASGRGAGAAVTARVRSSGGGDGLMRVARTDAGVLVETDAEAETDRLGGALAQILPPGTVLGLIGPLGAGKTRLVRALAEGLGADPRGGQSHIRAHP